MARSTLLTALVLLLAVSTTGWAQTPTTRAAGSGSPVLNAPTGGDIVLWDQTDNNSYYGYNDQDFEAAYDAYDNEGAADFTVTFPNGWDITQVNIAGFYSTTGPASAVSVAIYPDSGGLPGAAPICDYPSLGTFTDNSGSFSIPLPSSCSVGPGTYWVAHQASVDVLSAGQHFWFLRTSAVDADGAWRNPGNGFGSGCTDWVTLTACFDALFPDFLFQIVGQERAEPVPAINRVGLALLLAALMAGSFFILRRRSV